MILYLNVIAIVFLMNFLTGMYRARKIKFSQPWFLGIYLPLLFLILVSFACHLPWFWVIANLLTLSAAQTLGTIYQENKLTMAELEKIEQISDLQLSKSLPEDTKDEDIAVVLMNMGGPINLEEVEPFLRRLFNDALIIRFPFAQSFFADILIRARLKEVKERYKLIGSGSPILASSLKQVEALASELKKRGRRLEVFLSFNYSDPLPAKTMAEIKEKRKRLILTLSLYPHYSLSTTASNLAYLKQEAQLKYPQVNFLVSYSYHLYDGYIQAFVDRINDTLKASEKLDDFYLLFSAHGTPLYFVQEGDQYSYLISQSISRILASLKRKHHWSICYQSAVGPLVWLKPSTDATLKALAQRGVKKIIVVPISFVTDHIETLCEIDIEYRELAQKHGVEDFRMTRAIECHQGFISALADCVEDTLKKVK